MDERTDQQVDQLPEDLDITGMVGPYVFPDNSRRRVPGFIYLGLAVATIVATIAAGDSPMANGGLIVGAVGLALVGVYHLQSGWHLKVDEADALVAAVKAAGFPVGHASAQMAWRGLRSRPTWRILVYSNESPPERRGLVFIDGIDATVVACHTEARPDDDTGEWGTDPTVGSAR
ncbi:MAG: hypothetical protein QF638_07970 [Acidimicrobiales bacterium]|nr:hypothetical protein [Acidimicrobiaceae bacterium]MDP6078109.1 hypothetical protein [Acidimicrobiales bacterium]HJO79842.1 hypothetical protein [Acidimicrobiales bacterium]